MRSRLSYVLLQAQNGENSGRRLVRSLTLTIEKYLKAIPTRFCYECLNKATGERKCIICGGHRSQPVGKLILCELCPRSYHQDCYIPPMLKAPRGKWYCSNCASRAPPKKRAIRKPKELKTHNSSQSLDSSHDDIAPAR